MKNTEWFRDPGPDLVIPPDNIDLIMDSHGSRIYGRLLMPARKSADERPPVVLLLHGYPGNEQNIDIAQSLRMAGIAAVNFNYRGIWGGHGYYSFSNQIEDVFTAAEDIQRLAPVYGYDVDSLYLFGHSMGGFNTLNALSRGLKAKGAILLAPCDMGWICLNDRVAADALFAKKHDGYFRLETENALEEDAEKNAGKWAFTVLAEKLDPKLRYLFIGASRDEVCAPDTHIKPVLNALEGRGADVRYREFDDVHSFASHRISLASTVIEFIDLADQAAAAV